MKALFVVFAALVATAFAAEEALLSGAALCSNPCLQPVLTNGVGKCQPMQLDCLCGSAEFYSQVSQCLAKECSTGDIKQTLDAADKLCSSFGISIPTVSGIPTTASGIPTTASGTPTAKTTSENATSHTSSSPTATATGAATHPTVNGLGVAGAALAAYLFL